MILRWIDAEQVFVTEAGYEERGIPKGAGFRWDTAKKRWWTDDVSRAQKLMEYGDSATYERLVRFVKGKQAALDASTATDADITIPVPEGHEYLPFQKAGIAYAASRARTLLADEMGLGKTIQAIGLLNLKPEIKRVLIVAPAVMKLTWKRMLEEWLVRPRKIQVVHGKSRWNPDADITIINYDILTQTEKREKGPDGKLIKQRGRPKAVSFRFPELGQGWDMVIADEVHYAKNDKAKRSRALYRITDKAREVLFLTGTPILNKPVELFPIIDALGFDMKFWTYAKRYCNATQGPFGWDMSGASNLEELQLKLRTSVMIRRLKSQVLTELPSKCRQVIEVEPEGYETELENERKAEAAGKARVNEVRARMAELKKRMKEPGHEELLKAQYEHQVNLLREAQMVAFEEMSRVRKETAVAKTPDSISHIEALLENTDKLVVFAHHKEVVSRVADAFQDICVVVDGSTPLPRREENVKAFQEDKGVRLFIGSTTACGVGITLTASSTVLFLELDWVPANMRQAEDRCHRIGQRDSVLVQYLVVDGSLDARMAQTLVKKERIADRALDSGVDSGLGGKKTVADLREELSIPKRLPDEGRAPAEGNGGSKGGNGHSGAQNEPQGQKNGGPGEPSAEIRKLVHDSLKVLAGVCDYASAQDGQGFSRFDADFGHSLASRDHLTDRMVLHGLKLCKKYRRQLELVWDEQVFKKLIDATKEVR